MTTNYELTNKNVTASYELTSNKLAVILAIIVILLILNVSLSYKLSKTRGILEIRDRRVDHLEKHAIKLGYARYNPKTGYWEWVERDQ